MKDMHVNACMAVGHYRANVTYPNEKVLLRTGERNKEVVPNTQLPEHEADIDRNIIANEDNLKVGD